MQDSTREKYTVVVGLEVHAQLLTASKIFSADANAFGMSPNTNVGIVSLAYPGTLPLLNESVLELAIRMGLACHCDVAPVTSFDRKNYFYPDLPKGYQITQDRSPICRSGFVTITLRDGSSRDIRLNRIHLEEDAGKSIHQEGDPASLVDFNRAGVPLIEIVTEPDLRSSEEASAVLTEIRKLVRYLGICDGNMEEGSLRCDANVSVMLKNASVYGKKVEIKNMNSIRNVQRAIDSEAERQILLLEEGKEIVSETRLFDVTSGQTIGMRTKEELNDYRYFPDPDLCSVEISAEWLAQIRQRMPELPRELYQKYLNVYDLPAYDAQVLTDSRDVAHFFEQICVHTKNYKAASNWVMGPVKGYINAHHCSAEAFPVSAATIAHLINWIDEGRISHSSAIQKILPELIQDPGASVDEVAKSLNLLLDNNQDNLLPIIDEVIHEFPLKVEEFRKGKKGILSMFMGEVMKRSKGKADPKKANALLSQRLKEKIK